MRVVRFSVCFRVCVLNELMNGTEMVVAILRYQRYNILGFRRWV